MTQIAVLGAGLIGIYLGGRLAAGGADVILIGRPRLLDPLADGLRLSALDGFDRTIPAPARTADPTALAGADLILLTTKSQHSEAAAADVAAHARPGTPVLSFQNGVSNADRLRPLLPANPVIAGMVPYNVAARGPAHYHQGTGGSLAADRAAVPFAPLFQAAGLAFACSDNMPGVMWGKLLVNLNNAINALSGIPLAHQLIQRDYRRAWALCVAEGLRLLKPTGITLVDPLPLPLKHMPLIMSLPNPLYRRVVSRAGKGGARVDPHARSSMADDLAQGRATEVDWINGELLRLAASQGRTAPINARVIKLVRAAEAGAAPWPATALYKELKSAR